MPELRGSHKVHFLLALTLYGVEVLLACTTWLPGEPLVPKALMAGLFVAVFPVYAVALIRCIASGARLFGASNAGRMASYVKHLPTGMKVVYGLALFFTALCLTTAGGGARDVHRDEGGYYYTRWNNTELRSERVPLTRSEYEEAAQKQLRVFTAGPGVFYVASSFLVLCSASARTARTAHQRSTIDPQPMRPAIATDVDPWRAPDSGRPG